ncbi:MAG: UvrD-helicase domain-containing protein [Myxococcota bacterium]
MGLDLEQLNPEQRDAVLADDDPLLVLAGAGTGKTTVITYRIAHFMEARGVRNHEILAVTFTNKAAREMRERAARLAKISSRDLDIGTFHGTCGRVLRRFGDRLGLDRGFTIYDSDDQLSLIKKTTQDLNIDTQAFSPKVLRSRIESWKNKGLLPEEVEPSGLDLVGLKAREVYGPYRKRCLEMNAVDFGDLLLHVVTLLKRDEAVRRSLQSRWRFLLVDEYQDTNPVQYQLLQLLATDRHSLTVVGDDDQSIYRWRGADIGNILRFERDFPGAQVIRLEENYRSTQAILDTANAVIAHNSARKGKTLFTRGQSGAPVRLRLFATERDEGEAVAEDCAAWIEEGRSPSELAVLYRTNAQSRPIEDALRRRRVPYTIYGGLRFYDRREIKDALAFLRILVNPRSDVDLLRIINVPTRGLGKTSVQKITSYALQKDLSVFEASRGAVTGEPKLTGKAKSGLTELVEILTRFQARAAEMSEPGRLVEEILEDVGYLQMLRLEGTEEAEGRLDNLAELVAGIDEYTEEAEDPSLIGFLESVALASDIDAMNDTEETMSLMTLHSAKGLEFPLVFLPGMEEGLFPHSRSADDHAGLEEERRLAYVGITRAKDHVVLSAARVRHVFGEPRLCELSRFVGEIPSDMLEVSQGPGAAALRNTELDEEASFDLNDPPGYEKTMEPYRRPDPQVPEFTHSGLGGVADTAESDAFPPGTRVYHASFGEGVVISSEGALRRQKLTVDFPSVGRKVIVARFVEKVIGDAVDDVPF